MTPDERRTLIAECKVRMAALERDFAEYSDGVDRFDADVTALAARARASNAQADRVLASLRVRA